MSRTTRPAAIAVFICLTLMAACQVGPTVRTYEQLEDSGSAELYSIRSAGGESSIEVALENTTDSSVRVVNMEWTILDGEGFAQATVHSENDVEIPPRAKEKVTFTVATNAEDIATVRLWPRPRQTPWRSTHTGASCPLVTEAKPASARRIANTSVHSQVLSTAFVMFATTVGRMVQDLVRWICSWGFDVGFAALKVDRSHRGRGA